MHYFVYRPKMHRHWIDYSLELQGLKYRNLVERFEYEKLSPEIWKIEIRFNSNIYKLKWSLDISSCNYMKNNTRILKYHPTSKKREVILCSAWPYLELKWSEPIININPRIDGECDERILVLANIALIPNNEDEFYFLRSAEVIGWDIHSYSAIVIMQSDSSHDISKYNPLVMWYNKLKIFGNKTVKVDHIKKFI